MIWNSNHKHAGRIFTVPENTHIFRTSTWFCALQRWGGVGWGNSFQLPCTHIDTDTYAQTHTHTLCYATGHNFALVHIRHATLLVLFHLHSGVGQYSLIALARAHTHIMLYYWMFSWARDFMRWQRSTSASDKSKNDGRVVETRVADPRLETSFFQLKIMFRYGENKMLTQQCGQIYANMQSQYLMISQLTT